METRPMDVKNRLVVCGDQREIARFMQFLANPEENRLVDFAKIIPYPEGLYLGPITADALQEHGQNNWYDFNKRFWGTYYNAYEAEQFGNIIDFLTAWKPPLRVIKKIPAMFPNLRFTFKYAARKYGGQIGQITMYRDSVVHHKIETKEDFVKLHRSLWPIEDSDTTGIKP